MPDPNEPTKQPYTPPRPSELDKLDVDDDSDSDFEDELEDESDLESEE
jgi:hypothetical protein